MGISLHFHYTGKREKAPRIPHSLGLKKTRLHLYDGYTEGKDKFAVFTKKVTFKENQKVPDSLKGRFIYQQIEESNDYYKINKRSLQKRLGITSAELMNVKDHNYRRLIEVKLIAKLNPASGEQNNTQPKGYLERMLASNATLLPQIISTIPNQKRTKIISDYLEQIDFFSNPKRATKFLEELQRSDFSTIELMRLFAEIIDLKIKELNKQSQNLVAPKILEFCKNLQLL